MELKGLNIQPACTVMKKEKKSKNFIDKPVYEGGPTVMAKFIDDNIQYPEEARKEGIKGTVIIRYTIDYKGTVIETKVVSGIGYGCDEEAQRVVGLLKFQMGKYRNMKIQFHKTIKVHFRAKK
ncbi:MAG: energy transducer TonB, partial [Bacteroidia bacterium]|nr:energy transducer TonB [Bacteroidia bacterium]